MTEESAEGILRMKAEERSEEKIARTIEEKEMINIIGTIIVTSATDPTAVIFLAQKPKMMKDGRKLTMKEGGINIKYLL